MFMHVNQREKFQRIKRSFEDLEIESEESEEDENEEELLISQEAKENLVQTLQARENLVQQKLKRQSDAVSTLTLAPELEAWAQTISELPASDRKAFDLRVKELVIEKERKKVESLIWKELDIGEDQFTLPQFIFERVEREHRHTDELTFTCHYLNVQSYVTVICEFGVSWTFSGWIGQPRLLHKDHPVRFLREIQEFEATSHILEDIFLRINIEDIMVDKLKLMHMWKRIIYTQQWASILKEYTEFLGKVSPIHYYKNRVKTWAINVSRPLRKDEVSMDLEVYAEFFQAKPIVLAEFDDEFDFEDSERLRFVVELPPLQAESSFYDIKLEPREAWHWKDLSYYRISPWANSEWSTWFRDPEDDSQIQELKIEILVQSESHIPYSWKVPSPYCVIDMRQLNEWMISEIFSILGLEDMAGSEYGWFHDEECPPPKPIAWRYGQIVDEYFNIDENTNTI